MHVTVKGCDIEGLRCTHCYCILACMYMSIHAYLPVFERVLNHSCDRLDRVHALTFAARNIATRL